MQYAQNKGGMMPLNIKDIVKKYLLEYGYDGLCNTDIDCGCQLSDLIPCDYFSAENCRCGFLGKSKDEDDGFGIYSTKSEAQASHFMPMD